VKESQCNANSKGIILQRAQKIVNYKELVYFIFLDQPA
jgi:hypothetical protein